MAALGLSRLGEDDSARCSQAARRPTGRDRRGPRLPPPDPGAIAITAWAAAEVTGTFAGELFERLRRLLATRAVLPSVDVSWTVTAAVAAAGSARPPTS